MPSASAFATAPTARLYVKTAQSGARRAQAFCPECGTHVYAFAADDPQDISIRTGTFRAALGDEARPDKEISGAAAVVVEAYGGSRGEPGDRAVVQP